MEELKSSLSLIIQEAKEVLLRKGLNKVVTILDSEEKGVPIALTLENVKPNVTVWLDKKLTDEFMDFLRGFADISRDDIEEISISISDTNISIEVSIKVDEFNPREAPEAIIPLGRETAIVFTPTRGLVITFTLT